MKAPSRQQRSRLGRPSPEQTREKMEEVLRVGRREFVRNGYRATVMNAIAAAADVSKRTLYLWHEDKAALFQACVLEGARRFPVLNVGSEDDVETVLKSYAAALARELSADSSFYMGLLVIREGRDFPELARASGQATQDYLVGPLARYLQYHGLERAASTGQAQLLIAMILSEVHASLLMSGPPPGAVQAVRQAHLAVDVFLRGCRVHESPV